MSAAASELPAHVRRGVGGGLRGVVLPASSCTLRDEVREFLAGQRVRGSYVPVVNSWLVGWDPAFSAELGQRGWVGMAVPEEYGGRSASAIARFVVAEELLAAGAPVAAHWIADRQIAPNLMKFGGEQQRLRYLPAICRGETYFCLGMSEPDAGSDLKAVRTRADKVAGGWRVNGTKLWTSGAHRAQFMMALVRSGPPDGGRHNGLSQVIIDMSGAGVTVRPVTTIDGRRHFNEVVLENVFVSDDDLVGVPGNGWAQCTSELAFERSGPERVLSSLPVLTGWVSLLRAGAVASDRLAVTTLGSLTARLVVLRELSMAVAGAIDEGRSPQIEAALYKDIATQFEGALVDAVRRLAEGDPAAEELQAALADAIVQVPGFTLRGGANEILRGIVAGGLGIR
jgi:acyl-CoA dehydrogenase